MKLIRAVVVLSLLGTSGVLVAGPDCVGNTRITHNPPSVLYYANGAVLKNERGQLFYHDGSKFIDGKNIYYPSWQGGYYFRTTAGFAGHLFFYLPNKAVFVEHNTTVSYPIGHPQERRNTLYNGHSFYFRTGQVMASRDDGNYNHSNGLVAWDRAGGIFNEQGQPVNQVDLVDTLRPMPGEIRLRIQRHGPEIQTHFALWMDPFHCGYVSPIVFQSQNGLPKKLFEGTLEFQVETGIYGEFLTVWAGPDGKVTFEYNPPVEIPGPPNDWPIPYPHSPNLPAGARPNAPGCSGGVAHGGGFNSADPPGFVRRARR